MLHGHLADGGQYCTCFSTYSVSASTSRFTHRLSAGTDKFAQRRVLEILFVAACLGIVRKSSEETHFDDPFQYEVCYGGVMPVQCICSLAQDSGPMGMYEPKLCNSTIDWVSMHFEVVASPRPQATTHLRYRPSCSPIIIPMDIFTHHQLLLRLAAGYHLLSAICQSSSPAQETKGERPGKRGLPLFPVYQAVCYLPIILARS